MGLKGIALTDHEILAGHVEWLQLEKKLKEENKIPKDFKCILGNEIYLTNDRSKSQKYFHFILIAKDTEGHKQLRELSSKAWYNSYYDRGMERVPTLKSELKAIIEKNRGHIIATSACFKKGTKVLTFAGEKNIEDINENDFILNKYGNWEKVNFPTSRDYSGNGYKITFLENDIPIVCTENHKFFVTTSNKLRYYKKTGKNPLSWVEAKNLICQKSSSKHICLFPVNITYSNNDVLERKDWEFLLLDKTHVRKKKIHDKIKITPEIMRLFGLFLGDGHISINKDKNYYNVGLSFNYNEFDYYWKSFIKKASEDIGIVWSKNIEKNKSKIELSSHNIDFVEFFYYLFNNSKANTKFIPDRLKNISKELDFELIFGYELADGYFRTHQNKEKNIESGEMVSTSISKQLSYDFHNLLTSLGIRNSIYFKKGKVDKNNINHQDSWYITSSNNAWKSINKKTFYSHEDVLNIFNKAIEFCSNKYIEIDGICYKKVYLKKIEKLYLNEKVYCLNVNSHSFVCNGVVVHNCLGGELPNLVLTLTKAESARNRNEDEINSIKSEIVNFLKFCTDLFGKDFYIEIAPNANSKDQISFNNRVKDIARALGIKMIFATDAHYLTAKDRPMHKAYLNSKEGEREVDGFYWAAHLMDNQEAFENLYPYYNEEEFSELCANTMEIFDKVGEYDIFHNPIIPTVEVKDYPKTLFYFGVNNSYKDELDSNWKTIKSLLLSDNPQERYWINQCMEGLLNKGLFNDEYISRIETEADIIKTISEKLGNCLFAYFNTFQHYIDLFWECGSLSGPGRGSSVCFLSNYLLGITQLDPIKWELMEWRFLNKERVELPDIDTDLSPSKRKLIFKKIREERGELNLLQVATFGTEGTRSAILTACRGYRGPGSGYTTSGTGDYNSSWEEIYHNGIDIDIAQYMTSLIPQERGFLWPLTDVVYGNEEKERKPVTAFIEEVNKYPGLLDIMFSIEGLVNKRSQHASGVILYNNSPFETNALMRSPNGDLTTQFALHESEALGDTKFDFLVTEICDKITNALNLLKDDGYFQECNSLREIYEKYLHPEVINLEDKRIWEALAAGTVLDVFQFNSDVGLQAAKLIKAENPIEMTMANALMRLMGEKGKERPLDRYVRLKNNIQEWYQEVRARGLSENEIKVLERYYLPRKGVPALQEDLMLVCMDKDIAHFTLKEANNAFKNVVLSRCKEEDGPNS